MSKRLGLALFLVVMVILLAACYEAESTPAVYNRGEITVMEGMNWMQVNPPRPGLRCWVAWWNADRENFRTGGYAISYCEEE